MPVEKATPTTLKKTGGTYVVIPSETVEGLTNPDALAILVYLLDRPADWIIHRDYIRKRFGIGRDRYEKAMRQLKDKGLAWREYDRDKEGHIKNTSLCIRAAVHTENPPHGKTRHTGKPDERENPNNGKTDLLHSTESITQNKDGNPDEKSPGPRRLLPDWEPSEKILERAVDLGMVFNDFPGLVAEFRDYWISTGKRKKLAGWDQTFMNRLKSMNAQQKQKGPNYAKGNHATNLLADDLQQSLTLGGPS